MIIKNLVKLTITGYLLLVSGVFAASSGLFFNVSPQGTSIKITTTISNLYQKAGIKISTPGYTINSVNSGCTLNPANGYCIFPVSNTQVAIIQLAKIPGPLSFILCLNAGSKTPLSCQNYTLLVTGTLYAARANGTIQISPNNGKNWTSTKAPDGFPVSGIFVKNNILYAGTYKGNVAISNNQGATWQLAPEGPDNPVFSLTITPNNTIYAATNNGLTSSSNGGLNWPSILLNQMNIIPTFSIFSATDGSLYRATSSGDVAISKDNGSSWTNLTPPDGSAVYGIVQSNNKLYAATDKGNVKISIDKGKTWQATTPPDGSAVYSIFVTDSGLIYASTSNGNLKLSINQGKTWSAIISPNKANPVLGLFVA